MRLHLRYAKDMAFKYCMCLHIAPSNKAGEIYTGAGEASFNGQALGRKQAEIIDTISADETLQDAIYQATRAALERSYKDADNSGSPTE